jgi:hypothetical protein
MGLSVEMVARGTGLSEKEVQDLQNPNGRARKRGRPSKKFYARIEENR